MAPPHILVTGAAGFVGFHVARRLLAGGHRVLGVDSITDYYATALKRDRLAALAEEGGFAFAELDVCDREGLDALFDRYAVASVIHLAAQAGVRYSITHPAAYVHANQVGFFAVIEACRARGVDGLTYASSSSVYGNTRELPFSEATPLYATESLYAATKLSNEIMAASYAKLYALRVSGVRLFTVYGEWGRPDMAVYKFIEAAMAGREVEVYNHGKLSRDFTYVGDIAALIVKLHLARLRSADPPGASRADHEVYNIGSGRPVALLDFLKVIERVVNKPLRARYVGMQPGDVYSTYASTEKLRGEIGEHDYADFEAGMASTVDWHLNYPRRL